MYENTIHDKLEEIKEPIELINEWSKDVTSSDDFMLSPTKYMAFNACVMRLQVIGEHVGKLLKLSERPLDEKSASLGEKGVSLDEKGLSLDEKSASLGEKGVSLDEKGLSLDEKSASLDKKGVSLSEKGLSLDEKSASSGEKGVSLNEKGLSLGKKSASLGKKGVSKKKQVVAKILSYCKEPKSIAEIADYLGMTNRYKIKVNYLDPLLGTKIAMTKPNVPTSPKQKYFTIQGTNED